MTDEEKIEQAANQYGIYSAPINDREAQVQLAVDFEAGVQWRDKNPSPEVLKLVEALKAIDSASFKDCLGCQSSSEYGYEIARDALTEWEKK